MATQLERRTATRARLLDAAMLVLVEAGGSGFTTTEVGLRAGLSQGALFRHFPTKAHLLAATVEHLFAELRARYEEQMGRLRPGVPPADRLRIAFVLLWETFQDPRLAAAYDLFAAARTDADLQGDLQPIVRAHVASLHAFADAAFGDAVEVDRQRFHTMVDLVAATMQGLVVNRQAVADPDVEDRVRALLAEVVVTGLHSGPPPNQE
jgi:AcrR family transcriptional regulator